MIRGPNAFATYQRGGAPTNIDDETKGYKIGDIWIDTGASTLYTALDVSTDAAIWHGPH